MKMRTFLSTKDGLYGSAISGIHVTFIRMSEHENNVSGIRYRKCVGRLI
jgi:hypothetical protein